MKIPIKVTSIKALYSRHNDIMTSISIICFYEKKLLIEINY